VGLLVAGRREPVIWAPRFDSAKRFAFHDRDESCCGPVAAAQHVRTHNEAKGGTPMSYLVEYAVRRPATAGRRRRGIRVDERIVLNRPKFDGGAHVRVYVEDTSARRARFRRSPPTPHLRLRIADCVNEIALEFSVSSPELRENSLHKIETLLEALSRFRNGLEAEAELYAARERR
jgi:hypothetical protein